MDFSEIQPIVNVLAQEKNLDHSQVLQIIEDALALSLRKNEKKVRDSKDINDHKDFRVSIDGENKKVRVFQRWRVLDLEEIMESPEHEITLEIAHDKYPEEDLNPGDFIEEEIVPAPTFSKRIFAQTVKQYCAQRFREEERKLVLDEFKQRGEDLVQGVVRKVDRVTNDIYIDAHAVECVIRKEDLIPKENLRQGDRVRAMIKNYSSENRGAQVMLTRISVDFLKKLFEREVPEIEKGILEIVNAVRDPGYRGKVAVRSHDPRVDPVGTCVGIRGSRVQSVTNELGGERIDIIQWEEEPADYVIKALSPATVERIVQNDDDKSMDIIVEEENCAVAIGRNGMNVRLASELTGWTLNITTDQEYDKKNQEEMREVGELFMNSLDIDENMAQILYDENFRTLEEIAYSPRDELMSIEGFDNEETVDQLQERAKKKLEVEDAEIEAKMEQVEPDLIEIGRLDENTFRALIAKDILTVENLAELSVDDLIDLTNIRDKKLAETMIMKAREILYADEDETD